MNTLSTRIVIVALAVIFLCGNLLNYPFYRFAVSQAKAEMRRELFGLTAEERQAAITLTFTQEEYRKALVEENELRVNGNMYDVISASVKEGKVIVCCFSDGKENVLNAWMNKVSKEDGQQNVPGKSSKQLKLAFSADFVPAAIDSPMMNSTVSSAVVSAFSPAVVLNGHQSLPELPPRA